MRTASDDPAALSPHERLRELTAILATGIYRLRAIPSVTPEDQGIPAESPQSGLDPGAQTRPDGTVFTKHENGDR